MDILLSNITPLEPLSDYKIHFAVWSGEEPLDVYLRDADEWRRWNESLKSGEKDIFNRRYIFSLIRYYPLAETWLFGGVFEVLSRPRNKPYTVQLSEKYKEYIGRLLVAHSGPGVRGRSFLPETYFDQLKVAQILDKPYQGEVFPGYEDIAHDFSQLESIIHQAKLDWKTALESVKGVYLITDKKNGKMYVGSAYGEAGIWSRWCCYIGTGHGWNDELAKLIKQFGIDYARENFQLSVLEQRAMHSTAPTNKGWAFGPYRVGSSRWSYQSGGACYRVLTRPRKVGTWVQAEAPMSKRKRTKFVHEGNYVAEVDVELLEEPKGWSPYLSLEDTYRLDDVREALRRGDVKTAAKYARVFSLTPVAV